MTIRDNQMNKVTMLSMVFGLVLSVFIGPVLANDAVLENAYANHQSQVQVQGSGVVIKVLPDDNNGSRHQRFIIKLASGQTVLVAHNIDLAPKITAIKENDLIAFYGVYEWNAKGGVIHWTHRDPNNRHVHGWLKHDGNTFE
jgi:hypothetical protein